LLDWLRGWVATNEANAAVPRPRPGEARFIRAEDMDEEAITIAGRVFFDETGAGSVRPPDSPGRSLFSAEPDPQQFPMPQDKKSK
jgi:hypothetical protein